jgi:hypothetical protein
MGSITSYCVKVIKDNFKLLTWLQIFVIAIAPNFIFFQVANANALADQGWSATKRLVQGATTFYDGAKNVVLNGKNYAAAGTAAITPTASQVAKMIVRTGAVVAVDIAIKMLIGAVEYAMDPANNRVVYSDASPPRDPTSQYYYLVNAFGIQKEFSTNAAAAEDACKRNAVGYGWKYISSTPATWAQSESGIKYASCIILRDASLGNETFEFVYQRVVNTAYDPNAQSQNKPKYLPYDVVASQIISDAVANKADGKAYVSSVADTALEQDEQKQIVSAQDIVNQFDNNKTIPTTNTAEGISTPKADPADPTAPKVPPTDIKLNFPIFCDWAPTVCEAAQAGINYVASYTKDVDALKKEYADNPKFNDKPLEFDKDPATPDTTISFDGSCPSPLSAPYSFMGISGSIEFPFTPLCKVAEVSKPVIIAVSAYFAALIIGGIRSGDA